MELSSLSSADLAAQRAYQDATAANVEKMRQTAQRTSSASTDEELMSACKEFEAYFLEQVFKEMQKSVDVFKKDAGGDKTNDTLVNFFRDNTLQSLCKTATERQSLGLARMLYENMKANLGERVTVEELEAREQGEASEAAS